MAGSGRAELLEDGTSTIGLLSCWHACAGAAVQPRADAGDTGRGCPQPL